jgi:hypothetical protein
MSRLVLFFLRALVVLRVKRLFRRSSAAMVEQENAALRDELRLLRRATKRRHLSRWRREVRELPVQRSRARPTLAASPVRCA